MQLVPGGQELHHPQPFILVLLLILRAHHDRPTAVRRLAVRRRLADRHRRHRRHRLALCSHRTPHPSPELASRERRCPDQHNRIRRRRAHA